MATRASGNLAQLWAIAEGNIADFFEPYDAVKRDHTGQPQHTDEGALSTETRVRPKLLTDLPPELAALIEDITFDNKGRAIPKLYSKLAASKESAQSLTTRAKPTSARPAQPLPGDVCPPFKIGMPAQAGSDECEL